MSNSELKRPFIIAYEKPMEIDSYGCEGHLIIDSIDKEFSSFGKFESSEPQKIEVPGLNETRMILQAAFKIAAQGEFDGVHSCTVIGNEVTLTPFKIIQEVGNIPKVIGERDCFQILRLQAYC